MSFDFVKFNDYGLGLIEQAADVDIVTSQMETFLCMVQSGSYTQQDFEELKRNIRNFLVASAGGCYYPDWLDVNNKKVYEEFDVSRNHFVDALYKLLFDLELSRDINLATFAKRALYRGLGYLYAMAPVQHSGLIVLPFDIDSVYCLFSERDYANNLYQLNQSSFPLNRVVCDMAGVNAGIRVDVFCSSEGESYGILHKRSFVNDTTFYIDSQVDLRSYVV